jgi:hypothetical protein
MLRISAETAGKIQARGAELVRASVDAGAVQRTTPHAAGRPLVAARRAGAAILGIDIGSVPGQDARNGRCPPCPALRRPAARFPPGAPLHMGKKSEKRASIGVGWMYNRKNWLIS